MGRFRHREPMCRDLCCGGTSFLCLTYTDYPPVTTGSHVFKIWCNHESCTEYLFCKTAMSCQTIIHCAVVMSGVNVVLSVTETVMPTEPCNVVLAATEPNAPVNVVSSALEPTTNISKVCTASRITRK